MTPKDLGLGVMPDVTAAVGGGWLTVHRTLDMNILLTWWSASGGSFTRRTVDVWTRPDSIFPRVAQLNGREYVAYRGYPNGSPVCCWRDVTGGVIGAEHVMGRVDGNNPIIFGLGWLAWQDAGAVVIHGLNLSTGEVRTLRNEVVGTGISRLIGDPSAPSVVFIDDDRGAVPGMLNPVWSGTCVVGEAPMGGIAVQLGAQAGVLEPGADTNTPRCADSGTGTFAAVTYADAGPRVQLVLFTAADVVPPPPPPLTQPTFAFNHPVILAPFFATGSGLPELESLQADGRHFEVHDGYDDWIPPPTLKPWDAALRELYLNAGETIAQCRDRCLREVGLILDNWAGDVGVIPMFYDQLRWTEQQMLDTIGILSAVVNLSPRIKIIAPFAYQRANGIIKYASLQQALANLRTAAQTAGLATLTPVETPPAPIPLSEEIFVMAASQIMGIIHYASKKASSRDGCSNYILPNGRVFSCQPGGGMADRDPGSDGPWEEEEGDTGQETSGIATFHVNGEYYDFLAVKVDKLPS